MYICIHCGHHFDEPHNRYNRRWSDSDDSQQYCPNCGSEDFEEAEKCVVCGEIVAENKIVGHVCRDCLKKYVTRENAMKYALDCDQDVDEPADLREDRLEKYCFEDIYDFAEWVEAQHDAE